MKLCLLLAATVALTQAFAPKLPYQRSCLTRPLWSAQEEAAPCDLPSDTVVPTLNVASLRSAVVTSVSGDHITLEKLSIFLELNPNIPSSQIFVDNYHFNAYKTAGFGKLGDESDVGDIQMNAPKLGGMGGWWKYMTNAVKLAPIEEGKSGLPEGVLRLGGTFVIDGDDVLYHHSDSVPGDHPDLEAVMAVVENK